MSIFLTCFIVILIGFYIYDTCRRKEAEKSVQDLKQKKEELIEASRDLESTINIQKAQKEQLNNLIEHEKNQYEGLAQKRDILYSSIQQQEEYISSVTSNLESIMIKRKQEKKEELDEKLKQLEKSFQEEVQKRKAAIESELKMLEEKLASEAEKLEATISAIQSLQSEEEKEQSHIIQISEETKEDIAFLLNNVGSKLKSPNILYKLIWSEYIQKPTNTMLDNILPEKDCSGIYKITNLHNKKSYIGRSTSVRRRLTDHIKSTVGIGTIADQQVHTVMRKEGLWNFKFELIEACDKDLLGEREKYYIEFFKCQTWGYNAVGGSTFKGEKE